MFIRHPSDRAIINIEEYFDIRCCPKNPTHVDFYESPQPADERGTPDYTLVFKSVKDRDAWFDGLADALVPAYLDYDVELSEDN